ncbi:MAG: phosphatase PAP2 family protein [Chitinophagaceae bacterium]|nr:MAG: phosphatase PAP2 family protein [Chitinophagaceae bacterium]
MKKSILFFAALLLVLLLGLTRLHAQPEPTAGSWKTWMVAARGNRLPVPPDYRKEIPLVLQQQAALGDAGRRELIFWSAGSPGYRWHELLNKLWTVDTSGRGALANLVLGTAIYDATVAAWDNKYAFRRPRPYAADKRIHALAPVTGSPAYPCEHSVAAGVAVTVIAHFYPRLADSAQHMAERQLQARIAAGMAWPSDTRAGFELGQRVALAAIDHTKDFLPKTAWDGQRPQGAGLWQGQPMFANAGRSRTFVIDSSSQYRPGPPPDFAKDMSELKNYKGNFLSKANAFYYATQNFGGDLLVQKLFEYNLMQDAPRAARAFAATAIASYDCFVACWDAKYTYWATRPNQYDTSYRSLLPTPPFPGYPSGHAVMCGMMEELYSYLFPYDRPFFQKRAKEGAESRFQGGIHFRSDNDAGLDLGRKVAARVVDRLRQDKAD